jgi:hypothetical protein
MTVYDCHKSSPSTVKKILKIKKKITFFNSSSLSSTWTYRKISQVKVVIKGVN